jgi:hypothetical protein
MFAPSIMAPMEAKQRNARRVETSQVHGLSMPRRLRLRRREIEVVEVLDQWVRP